jgi:hypothetical protein
MPKFSKILISFFLTLSLVFIFPYLTNAANNDAIVYICSYATSLEEINPNCSEKIGLKLEEIINGMTLTITKLYSSQIPIGITNVYFERAVQDIDLTQIKVDTDLETKKSLLYMPEWPEVIEKEKILFVPK